MKLPESVSIEGMRHARDKLEKLWKKERQRAETFRSERDAARRGDSVGVARDSAFDLLRELADRAACDADLKRALDERGPSGWVEQCHRLLATDPHQ